MAKLLVTPVASAMAIIAGLTPIAAWADSPARSTDNIQPQDATGPQNATADSQGVPDTETATSDDIVVTARRRAERLQDVPIAVQAFTSSALQSKGILRASDLVNVTPSLKITSASQRRTSPSYELRGISSTESVIGQDSPVALYMDEVYMPRPVGTNGAFFDLESVQVLLGPQGTLFGRNAAAGAILFTSKRPTHKLEGELNAGIGNYGYRNFGGVLNLPLGEHVALRLAGQRNTRDGYTRDLTNNRDLDNQDDWAGRASLRISLDRFENTTIADLGTTRSNGSGGVPIAIRLLSDGTVPGQSKSTIALLNGDAKLAALLARQRARGPREVEFSSGLAVGDRTKAAGISNITTYELNEYLTLKNVVGHRYVYLRSTPDLDATPYLGIHAPTEEGSSTISEELQLQGKAFDNNLTYSVGAFYFHEVGFYRSVAQQFLVKNFTTANFRGVNKSASIFAQATYKLPFLDGLSLTAGGRYTWDERFGEMRAPTDDQRSWFPGVPACTYVNLPKPGVCYASGKASFRKPTWTVSLDYKVAPDVLVYVANRRGYRSGGLDARANDVLAGTTPFEPETVTDVEIGGKATWRLGGDVRLVTNLALFQTWYDNIQRNVSTTVASGGATASVTRITNAAGATVKGFEANAELHFGRVFTLAGYYGYSDPIIKKFNTLVAGVPTVLIDRPFGSMKNSGGVSVTVTPIDDTADGTVNFSANLAYSGEYYNTTAVNLTNTNLEFLDQTGRVPPRVIVNASLDWLRIKGTGISGQLWVRNLFDRTYLTSTLALYDSGAGFTSGLYGEPRMYGMGLKVAF